MAIKMKKLKNKGLIFSPDFIEFDKLISIIKECAHFFSGIKVGNLLLYKYGMGIIKEIKKFCDLPIICDFKLMDIPDISEEILRLGINNGIDGAMIWGVAGSETIQHCLSKFPELMIFILTEYTHTSEIINTSISDRIALEARELGAYGIQAPATKLERIKSLRGIVGNDLTIICCGVGHQGAEYGTAVASGADYEIIGRSIYLSKNPFEIAKNAYRAIHEA